MKHLVNTTLVIILAAAFTLTGNVSTAQETVFGLKGGANFSNLTLENNNDKNILTGFHLGGWVSLPLTEQFSLQPELLYSTKGTRWEMQESTMSADAKVKLDYLEIPVNLVYNLARDVDFQVGPYVGLLLSAKADATLTGGSGSVTVVQDLEKDNFKPADFGLQGGMRFALKPLYLGFTYKLGLSEVAADSGNARTFFGDASNRSIQLFVGYSFSSK